MPRIEIMGSPVDTFNREETIAEIERCIATRNLCQHVVVNATKVVKMREDPSLKKIIESCHIINADGMAVVWASKLLGKPVSERITGVDLFQDLIKICSEKGYKPFFLGAKQWVVEKVTHVFKEKYPNLEIAGHRNGYFSKEEEPEVVDQIRNSKADMLFVAIPTPAKEIFLNKWLSDLNIPFCMGVGGSFDVVVGKADRAPQRIQDLGFEWAYRLYQEPRRMWKRYAKTNPIFMLMFLKEYLKTRSHRTARGVL